MAFDPNPLFYQMCDIFTENYSEENKVIICNEGGSRSSKTWDAFHFIYTFCDHNRNQNNDIYILRETLVKCRDFTFKDFKKCMKVIGAKLNYVSEGAKPYVNIFGNNVYFRGLDDEENSEGYPSDIIFVNESLETKKSQVNGLKMRCRKCIIMDWNPKYTDHWCFDLEGQENVFFTRTNYTNNKHLQKSIIKEIESYEPWEPGSYEVVNHELIYKGKLIDDKNQPPPHKKNVEEGTADEFRWKVYGLGLRGAMKGVIFNQVKWIDEFPDMAYTYGNDFGFTNDPNALVRYAEDENNIWIELLWYSPVETAPELNEVFEAVGVEKNIPITCDSSDKYTGENKGTVEMVKELEEMGWLVSKVKKKRSIMYGITSMRSKKIHIVKNHLYQEAKKERENYRFKEVHGIAINQPIDAYNHCFSADTLVLTSSGYKKIIDVKIGDFVINSTGEYKVLNSFLSIENANTFNVRISCGIGNYFVTSTEDHKVKTLSGWKEIQSIKKGDHIWTFKNSMASLTTFTRESIISQKARKEFTELYGSFITEKYQKVFTSTTKIITNSIITLIILSLLTVLNILVNTAKIIFRRTKKKLENILVKLDLKQMSGIVQPKEENGIKNTLKGAVLELKNSAKEVVKFAEENLKRKTAHRNSVLTLVNHNTAGTKDLIMNLGTASFVGLSLKLINIPKQKPVLRNVLASTVLKSKKQNVYDLTVDTEHEFSANNIIVHNCWDAARYAHTSHNEDEYYIVM